MNIRFCVVKPEFYDTFLDYENVIKDAMLLSDEQQRRMFQKFDEQCLSERACLFFGCDLVVEEHCVSFHHKLRDVYYHMEIQPYSIIMKHADENPFLSFLKRLYRNNFTWEIPSGEETDTKVL